MTELAGGVGLEGLGMRVDPRRYGHDLIEPAGSRGLAIANTLDRLVFRWSRELCDQAATLLSDLGLDRQLRVIDAGCGTGHSTDLLRQVFPYWRAHLLGIDSSPEAIAMAESHRLLNTTYVHGDITRSYPLSQLPVDMVMFRMVLGRLERPGRALQLAMKGLQHGGLIAIQTFEDIVVGDDPRWPDDKRELAAAIKGYRDTMVAMFSDRNVQVLWGSELEPALNDLAKTHDFTVVRNDAVSIEAPLREFLPAMLNKLPALLEQLEAMPMTRNFSEDDRAARRASLIRFQNAATACSNELLGSTDILRWQHRLALIQKD